MNPSRSIRLALVTGLALANALVLVLGANSLFLSRQHYVHRAELLTQNVANALDQSLGGTIEKIDLSLLAVVDELQRQLSLSSVDAGSINKFLLLQEQRTPGVSGFRVAGSDGRVLFGKGVNEAGPVSLADRDYFMFLREHPDAGIQVTKALFGRVSKDYFIGASRAYRFPDGSFAGLIIATVPVAYFSGLLSRFDLGVNGAVVLRDADAGLIARVPPIAEKAAGKVGSALVSVEFRHLLDSGATTDTFFTAAAADGFARTSTFRRLEASHMLVIAAMAESDYLSGWSSERDRTISMGAGFLVLSLLLGVFLFRLIGQAERGEQKVRQSKAEELRFKDDFLSHVSHELRSPLTAIKQFTSILVSGLAGKLNEEQGQYQAIVLKNVHQLQSMIDDLLEVTRLETGKATIELDRVAVRSVAADAVQTLAMTAEGKGIAVSSELPANLPAVYADPTRLLQILIILLDNAIKFTPAGGSIRIRGRLLEENPGLLLLEVCDTGCGIAPELLQKLFERLYQAADQRAASRKGLGLGLYICRELVMRQGGTISVASNVGTGSTFSFTLPIFSLSRLLTPLIKNGRWPAESVALLTVQLRLPGEGRSSESHAGPPHEARNFLQRCLMPDLDLLLPTTRSDAWGETFFIAVFADEIGRSVLTQRIRDQFESSRALNRAGRTLTLSYAQLPAFEHEVGSSAEQAAVAMARSLENAVQTDAVPDASCGRQQDFTQARRSEDPPLSIIARNNVSSLGDSKEVMLYAHGFGCNKRMWDGITPSFSRTHRQILFDYVGSGASDLASFDAHRYSTLQGYVQDLLEVCDAMHLESGVTFVGHSVSCSVGMLASIARPHLFDRLVLIGPTPCFLNDPPTYHGGFEREDLEGLLSMMDKNYVGWSDYLAAVVAGQGERGEVSAALSNSFCSTDPVATRIFARTTFLSDNRSDLSLVSRPCLLLQHRHDALAPLAVGDYLHEHLKGSTLQVLDVIGHCAHLSHPALVVRAMKDYLGQGTPHHGSSVPMVSLPVHG